MRRSTALVSPCPRPGCRLRDAAAGRRGSGGARHAPGRCLPRASWPTAPALAAPAATPTVPCRSGIAGRACATALPSVVVTAMNFLGVPYKRRRRRRGVRLRPRRASQRHVFGTSLGLPLPRRVDGQAKAPGAEVMPVRKDELQTGRPGALQHALKRALRTSASGASAKAGSITLGAQRSEVHGHRGTGPRLLAQALHRRPPPAAGDRPGRPPQVGRRVRRAGGFESRQGAPPRPAAAIMPGWPTKSSRSPDHALRRQRAGDPRAVARAPSGHLRRPPAAARCATCASRSPTAATSAAATACRRKCSTSTTASCRIRRC